MKRGRIVWALAGAALVSAGVAVVAIGGDYGVVAAEQCVARCDAESDKCMAKAGGDERKAKACDDEYSECLKKCR